MDVARDCQCDDCRMARGLRMDCGCVGTGRIVLGGPGDTRDLDVCRVNAVVENSSQELGVCRDPWMIAGC